MEQNGRFIATCYLELMFTLGESEIMVINSEK